MKFLFFFLLTFHSLSHAKLSDVSSYLECLSELHGIDRGANQPDKETFGIEIRNRLGSKSLLLDRSKNEYLIYTEDEVLVCKIPKKVQIGTTLKALSNLSIKVRNTAVSVEVEMEKSKEGKINIISVAFGAKDRFPPKLTPLKCYNKYDEHIKQKLLTYTKERISNIGTLCQKYKNPTGAWTDDLYKDFCQYALDTCTESKDLKNDVEKIKTILFPLRPRPKKLNIQPARQI